MIFISYRRDDTAYVVQNLLDPRLRETFAREQVFLDIDSIPLGIRDFDSEIQSVLDRSRVVLVIIGSSWLTLPDRESPTARRIDNPSDFVHREIAAALARDASYTRVIPVVVSPAGFPKADELPGPLRNLARCNGMHLRPGPDLNADLARIVEAIRHHCGVEAAAVQPQELGSTWAGGGETSISGPARVYLKKTENAFEANDRDAVRKHYEQACKHVPAGHPDLLAWRKVLDEWDEKARREEEAREKTKREQREREKAEREREANEKAERERKAREKAQHEKALEVIEKATAGGARGGTLLLNELMSLPVEVAAQLAEWGRGDSGDRVAWLNGLTSLSADAAACLAEWGRGDSGSRHLYLNGLATLSADTAARLAEWGRGDFGDRALALHGLNKMPADAAARLAAWGRVSNRYLYPKSLRGNRPEDHPELLERRKVIDERDEEARREREGSEKAERERGVQEKAKRERKKAERQQQEERKRQEQEKRARLNDAPPAQDPGAGDLAPPFALKNQDGEIISNEVLRGKPYVLYFFLKDHTVGCTREACAFRDYHPTFEQLDITLLGVSRDSAHNHRTFRAKYDLPFDLLVDTNAAVIREYGCWKEKTEYGSTGFGVVRSTFLIDAKGRVERVWRNVIVEGHGDEVLLAARSLTSAPPADLIDHSAVCQRLGVDPAALYNLVQNGTFPRPVDRDGNRAFWQRAVVDAWAQAHHYVTSSQESATFDGIERHRAAGPGVPVVLDADEQIEEAGLGAGEQIEEAGLAIAPSAVSRPGPAHVGNAPHADLIDHSDVCVQLRIDPAHLYGLISTRAFPRPIHREGNRAFWQRAVVDAWARAHQHATGSPSDDESRSES